MKPHMAFADLEKLKQKIAHVIDNPPSCRITWTLQAIQVGLMSTRLLSRRRQGQAPRFNGKWLTVGILIGLSVLTHGFQGDTDQTILARAIFGEARGECDLGKIAVGWVIRNRVENPRWWGSCYHTVILKPWQFSAFNEGDPNLALLKKPLNGNPITEAAWWDSYEIAGMVLRGEVDDPTGGADHFHSIAVLPWWADPAKFTVQIGRHKFYRLR